MGDFEFRHVGGKDPPRGPFAEQETSNPRMSVPSAIVGCMAVDLSGYEELTREAVSHYWTTLRDQQAANRLRGEIYADRGRRSAVTGGKQMDGFCRLVFALVSQAGFPVEGIHLRKDLELPGYFRPEKKWDMVLVDDGNLVAAIEFKSQRGPSFGNNFNNRAEEAIGNARDLWTAYREGAFGTGADAPWLGWLMLLEDCTASQRPVGVAEPHFPVFPEFVASSYAQRYELLLRKLVLEKMYNSAALLLSKEEGGISGEYRELAPDLSIKRFLASLIGHIEGYLAAR